MGLAAALSNALADMALRNLGRTDDALTTVFYFLLIGVLVSAPCTFLFGTMPGAEMLPWIIGIDKNLIQLERAVFLAGYARAFQLFMDSCTFCKECSGSRTTCVNPRMARPSPETMAVDVYTTVRRFGFKINVRTGYDQTMDRFAFLMVH